MKNLMTNRCTIQRNTPTKQGREWKPSWSDHKTNQRCLYQEGKGQVVDHETGRALEYDAVLYLPRKIDIKPRSADDEKDRVIITRPSSPGPTLLVQFVADQSGFDRTLKAYLKRVASKT